MSRTVKSVLIIIGVLVLLVGYWGVDNFVYPIKSVHPNYSDVEQAFAKLQFPADWKEISSSENRGLHGRDCDPFNNSGCFHKSKKFTVPASTNNEAIGAFLQSSGCVGVNATEFTYSGEEKKSFSFSCVLTPSLRVSASLRGPESTLNVTVKTY